MVIGTALALAAGCGGDSGSALQGIYVISGWTVNTAACTEGPSILPQADTAMYLKNESFFGTEFLHARFCLDVAECEIDAAEDDTLFLDGHFLDRGNDGDGWTGGNFDQMGDDPDNCMGDFDADTLTGEAGGEIRIETRTIPVEGFPEDADGSCFEGARAAAEDGTCVALEVVTATFETDLP